MPKLVPRYFKKEEIVLNILLQILQEHDVFYKFEDNGIKIYHGDAAILFDNLDGVAIIDPEDIQDFEIRQDQIKIGENQ
jgi:hypothetical protein